MKFLFSPDGPVMRALGVLTDLIFLNILWLVCSLPVVTAGVSTTACYYVCLRMTRGDYSVARDFFQAFRQNFKQSTVLFLALVLMAGALVFDFRFLEVVSFPGKDVLDVALKILGALCIFTALYAFPLVAQFQNTLMNTVKNGILLCFKHFFRTFIMTAIFVLMIDAVLFYPVFVLRTAIVWVLYAVSGPIYLCSRLLKPVFAPYLEQAEG